MRGHYAGKSHPHEDRKKALKRGDRKVKHKKPGTPYRGY